ncbi:hypothetical protein DZF79_04205 [Vibrio parahaemolyticus]|nr:hypothetical protein [Vibrio parahaemolyticus]
MKVESNRHKTKVHMYKCIDRLWDMVAQNHIDMITAQNQAMCGHWRDLVTKDISKVTCDKCIAAHKKSLKEKPTNSQS